MSGARLYEVFRQEFRHNLRRPLFWMMILLLSWLTFELSTGHASLGSGDARVGGTKAWITSEYAISQTLIMLAAILYSFFISVGAGMSLIRDGDQKVGELLHSTRMTPGEYIWGKFLAQLASFTWVLAVHLATMIVFYHLTPHGENADYIGPFSILNYLKPALIFAMPTLIATTGVSFAIGGITRKPVMVFALPVGVVLFGAFFLWEWSPSWLALGWNRALQFVDLSGLRWINETWLQVDKGVAFYNRQPVGLDTLIVTQRLMCVALGLGAVAFLQMRFARALRGATARTRRTKGAIPEMATGAARLEPAPLRALGMGSGTPAFVGAALEVARVEWRELWKHPGLYLFVPMILLQTFGSVVDTGAFDTSVLQTSGILAVHQMNTLTLLVSLLILFYTTESLQREASSGFGPIHYATPIRTGALLVGKVIANAVLGVVIVLTCLFGCWITLLIQNKVPFSFGPFALIWGLLLLPTFLVWTAFVCFSFTVTGNRYGTYALGLSAMAVTGFLQLRNKMSWAFNWDAWSLVPRWSDISVLELDRVALVLNRLMVLGLAAFFVVFTIRRFPRREADATRTLHRLQPAALGREAAALAPWLALPLLCCLWLQVLVYNGRDGASASKKQRDYWKKNVATWKNTPTPSLASADFDLNVDPKRGTLHSKGGYVVANLTSDTLRSFPISSGLRWSNVTWTMNGKPYKPENRAGLYVFTPATPMAPGDRLAIGFAFDNRYPEGVSKNGAGSMEFVVPSAVVMTGFSSTAFAPILGYISEIGVEDDKNKSDPREYPDDYWKKTLPAGLPMFDGWCDTHFKVTGPAEFQHNVTGVLVNETVANGTRTTEWKSDAPVRAFNVVMGRWKVKRGEGVAVFYDARHPFNVDEMFDALVAARKYYGAWFAPFPYRELRVSEFPGLATYAQGSPGNITFSEAIGFLTKSEAKANASFWITAHEAAHQWWPCMAMPGDGPGGDVLSEGMAHFSTILLTEQARGLQQRMAFCRQVEDRYGNTRQRDSERPLVKVDGSMPGDNRIIYDRGGWAFWMLHRLMGRDSSLAGLRDYMATYRDSRDHPLLEEYLAVMRRHAPDKAAFDAYTKQWFFGTVVPQYLVEDSGVEREGNAYIVRARVKNVGTGTMPIEIAATRGERFPSKRTKSNAYDEARAPLVLGPGEEKSVVIRCRFEPEKLVTDPDVTVLMLERQKAEVRLHVKKAEKMVAVGESAPIL